MTPPDETQVSSTTPLEELRAELHEPIKKKTLLKRFPRLNGRFVGEYKVAPKADVRDAAGTENDEFLLDQCLLRILIEDKTSPLADANGLVPLGAWSGKPELDPLKFDHRLCDVLGFELGTYEETEMKLYEGNDLLLATHVGEIAEWSLKTFDQSYSDFPIAA